MRGLGPFVPKPESECAIIRSHTLAEAELSLQNVAAPRVEGGLLGVELESAVDLLQSRREIELLHERIGHAGESGSLRA